MFLHLGGDCTIAVKDVIAIVDINSKYNSSITKDFLKTAQEEGFVQKTSEEEPKSIIVAEINKMSKIFLSPISCATLLKRTNFLEF